jgi:predicted nucleotidyltransferase
MALACGASLVLELPLAYATASAERFAAGGVQLLAATGITRTLVFSSEHGRLAELDELAAILAEEPPLYRTYLKQQLDTGMSFAAARQQALALYLGDPARLRCWNIRTIFMAVEYLKAIHRLPEKDSWTPVTFQRQGPGYLDPDRSSPLASATAIRQVLAETRHDQAALLLQLAHAMPPASLGILLEAVALGQGPVRYEDLPFPY